MFKVVFSKFASVKKIPVVLEETPKVVGTVFKIFLVVYGGF